MMHNNKSSPHGHAAPSLTSPTKPDARDSGEDFSRQIEFQVGSWRAQAGINYPSPRLATAAAAGRGSRARR